ncbi:MAG: hypothetical protein KDB22_25085 [Planctomycetales bacterium]|nr:hypothetical protein [Planctomycetales bacterium]
MAVWIVDTERREVFQVWSGLTKREVMLRWQRWREHEMQAFLVALPENPQ